MNCAPFLILALGAIKLVVTSTIGSFGGSNASLRLTIRHIVHETLVAGRFPAFLKITSQESRSSPDLSGSIPNGSTVR